MSGRKQKTERKKAVAKEEKPQVFFEDALLAFLRNIGQTAVGIKERGGAQGLGSVAMSVCATESLAVARNRTDVPGGVQGYISAAAYALAAAMLQGGAWGLPPKPTSEQPPESAETPSEPSEGAAK